MRQPIVVGNWKMNKSPQAATELAQELQTLLSSQNLITQAGIAPTSLSLMPVKEAIGQTDILLCAQNCHFEDDGAYTGEISASMLKEAGVNCVILGHSERRQFFNETDEVVNKKVKKVLSEGLHVILCVGETLQEREEEITNQVIERQVKGGLEGVSDSDMARIVIAYEPVWAIGTGKTASPQQAEDVHAFIRNLIQSMYSQDIAQAVRIQYGGSVKSANARELFSMENIDGGLIGGASLKAEEFVKILTSF